MPDYTIAHAFDSAETATLPDLAQMAEQIASLREQVAVLQEQLVAIHGQVAAIHALLVGVVGDSATAQCHLAGYRPANGGRSPTEEVLARCGQDVVRVLRESTQPLTVLEMLDEMVRRQMR